MIANTQANPLSALLGSSGPLATAVMGSANSAQSPRFDLMLLELTKQISDSTAETAQGQALVPAKVSKALESALTFLSKQSPEQIQNLLNDPQFSAALVSQAAQEFSLDVPQQKQLEQLVGLVAQRLTPAAVPAVFQDSVDTSTQVRPVISSSGPQGGTTVTSPEPQIPTAQAEDPKRDLQQDPQMAAAMAVPVPQTIVALNTEIPAPQLISTRTEGISSQVSAQLDPQQGQAVAQPRQLVLTIEAMTPPQTESAPQGDPVPATANPAPQIQPQVVFAEAAEPAAPAPVILSFQPSQEPLQVPVAEAAPASPPAPQTVALPGIKNITTTTSDDVSQPKAPVSSSAQPAQQPQAAVPSQAAPAPQTMPFQVEVLTAQPQPQIVQGSEVTLYQASVPDATEPAQPIQTLPSQVILPQGSPQLPAPLAPLVTAQAQVPVLPDSAAAFPGQPVLSPVAAAPVAVPQQVLQVNSAAVQDVVAQVSQQVTFKAADSSQPVTLSPLRRWLSETMRADNGPSGNTPVLNTPTLNSDTLKDLAASVTREFGLRESVFQQALSAIEDASQGSSQLRIRLRPESLGNLDITLSIEGGKLTARIVASSTEVRDVFAGNLQQFKQSLEAQGLQVNQLSVAVRAEGGMSGQAGHQQQQAQAQLPWQPSAVAVKGPQDSAVISAFFASVGADPSIQRFSALA